MRVGAAEAVWRSARSGRNGLYRSQTGESHQLSPSSANRSAPKGDPVGMLEKKLITLKILFWGKEEERDYFFFFGTNSSNNSKDQDMSPLSLVKPVNSFHSLIS